MDVIEAILGRYSCRSFLDKPVNRDVIERILDAAKWSPSGANSQPWEVAVVAGSKLKILMKKLVRASEEEQPPRQEFNYYPKTWNEPFKSRRYKCGMGLYSTLGIRREDAEGRKQQWTANYRFFNAPVALFFSIDRGLAQGSIMDTGIFLQSIMLTAHFFELGTCPQAALGYYPDIVKPILNIPDSKILLCGMSLGYPDTEAPVNNYRSERTSLSSFVTWFE